MPPVAQKLFLGIFLCLYSLCVAADAPIIINSGANKPLFASDNGFYNLLIKEIFGRLKLAVQCIQLPSQRALINANSGIDDGNIARIAGLEKKYPNLIRVPTAVFEFEFVAYSKNPGLSIGNWNDLKPYVVGIIQGWQIYEKNIAAKLVTKVKTPDQLFNLLQNDRADVVMFDRHQGHWWLKQLNIQSAKMLTPPLVKKKMYIYMNKKHRKLIDDIDQAIKDIKKDGTYSGLMKQSLLQMDN